MGDLEKRIHKLRDDTETHELDWSRESGLSGRLTRALAKILGDPAHRPSNLRSLSLNGFSLGDEGAEALALLVIKGNRNTILTDLSLGVSKSYLSSQLEKKPVPITELGGCKLASALRTNHTLKTLDLRFHYLGPATAKLLAHSLLTNHTLQTLNLAGNQLGNQGAQALAEALRVNHGLTDLNLKRNNVGPKGAQALAEALLHNHYLTALNLEKNGLENKHLSPFLEAFQLPTSQSASQPHKPNRTVVLLDTHGIQSSSNKSLKTLQDCLTHNYNYLKAKKELKDDWKMKMRKKEKKNKSSKNDSDDKATTEEDQFLLSELLKLEQQHAPPGRLTYSYFAVQRLPASHLEKWPPTLQELFLFRCGLTSCPVALSRFTNLRLLDLHSNQLKAVPACLPSLTQLEMLSLANNNLTFQLSLPSMPSTSSSFPSSSTSAVSPSTSPVSTSPPTAFVPTTASKLARKKKGVTLARARKFNTLQATSNKEEEEEEEGIDEDGDSFQDSFPVGSFPNLSRLLHLRFLYLPLNALKDIPTSLFDLRALQTLDLSFNELTCVPSDISKLSQSLITLKLDDNKLSSLPEEIGLLSQLENLWLCGNDLQYLPVGLCRLPALSELLVEDNPLRTIPNEILSNGQQAILAYLRELKGGSESYSKVKLMFVGEANVGKTSLVSAFVNNVKQNNNAALRKRDKKEGAPLSQQSQQQLVQQNNLATDGIDITNTSWDDVTFRAWDFAGQDLYQTTHRFFLSRRAIYLLVFNLVNKETSKIEYWLQSLCTRMKDCPIIMVGTHLDDERCTKEYITSTFDGLKQRFAAFQSNILDYVAVSTTTYKGVKSLQSKIAAAAARCRFIGQRVPSSYVLLAKRMETIAASRSKANKPPILKKPDFEHIAIDFNVQRNNVDEALRFLHEVGDIMYFGQDGEKELENLVFLDPQWLTDVLATVVTLRHNLVKGGKLYHDDLPLIWKPPRYPPNLHATLRALLRKFDIIFPLKRISSGRENDKDDEKDKEKEKKQEEAEEKEKETEKERKAEEVANTSVPRLERFGAVSLVPCLLDPERPSQVSSLWPPFDDTTVQFAREYHFAFLPLGFFSRLFVRLMNIAEHTNIQARMYWRDGIVLQKGVSSRGLIEYNPSLFRLTVRVRITPTKDNDYSLLTILMDSVDSIIRSWFPDQLAKVCVPCAHCYRLHLYEQHLFPLEHCENAVAQGNPFVYCRNVRPVRVDQLAADIALVDARHLKVPFKQLKLEQKVEQQGNHAVVWRAVWNGEVVAVKQLIPEKEENKALVDKLTIFRREVLLTSGLIHPNIAPIKGICMKPLCIITTYTPFGNLQKFLHNPSYKLDWALRIKIAHNIAEGLHFLHSATPPIIHRQLRPENLLVMATSASEETVIKVTNFGLSVRFSDGMMGPEEEDFRSGRVAPELLEEGTKEHTEKVDVYCYALILWELLTRKYPFSEFRAEFATQQDFAQAIIGGLRPTIPSDCPSQWEDLIRQCWHQNPKQRPTFDQLLDMLASLKDQLAPEVHIPTKEEMATIIEKEIESSSPSSAASSSSGSASSSASVYARSTNNGIPLSATEEDVPSSISLSTFSRETFLHSSKGTKNLMWFTKVLCPIHSSAVLCLLKLWGNVWAGCSDGSITVWSAETGKKVAHLPSPAPAAEGAKNAIHSLLRVGHNVWAASSDGLTIWDCDTHQMVKTVRGTNLSCIIKLPTDIWCGSPSGTVGIYSSKKFKMKREIKMPQQQPVTALLSVFDAHVWIASFKAIYIMTSKKPTLVKTLTGHDHMVEDMVRVGSRVWSCSSDKTIRVWNDLGDCLQVLEGHGSRVFGLLPFRNYVWSYSWDGSMMAWDKEDMHFVQEITEAHQDAISALIPISDEDDPKLELWSASWDHTIHVWTDRALPSPLETEPTEVVVEVDLLSNNDKKNNKNKDKKRMEMSITLTVTATTREVIEAAEAKHLLKGVEVEQCALYLCFPKLNQTSEKQELDSQDFPLITKTRCERQKRALGTFVISRSS
ncbi:Myotubularin-like phosphatase domain [Balamuthia mandrillaris]